MRKQGRRATAGAIAVLGIAASWGCGWGEPSDPRAGGGLELQVASAALPPANRPPAVRRVALEPDDPLAGGSVSAVVDAWDPDGDPVQLTYRWQVDAKRVGNATDTLTLPARSKGDLVEVEVIPHDGKAEGRPSRASAWIANQPPLIVSLVLEPAEELGVEEELVASLRVEDPDHDPIEVRYTWLVNGHRVAEASRVLTSRHFRRGDAIELEVVASDGEDESQTLRSPPIRVVNTPPRITSTPGSMDGTGAFHYEVKVADADGDRRLRYRLLEGPQGMTLDWLRGELAWEPTESQEGRHPIEIEVDDLAGGKTTQVFELEVSFEPPASPEAESPAPPEGESPAPPEGESPAPPEDESPAPPEA